MKIFYKINSGLLNRSLIAETFTKEFINEIFSNWEKHFDDVEERDKFVLRILKKVYSNINMFNYTNDRCPLELEKLYIQFLLETTEVEELNFPELDSDDEEKFVHSLTNIDIIIRHSTLKKINLNNNQIGVEGAKKMGEALRFNTSLTSINLGSNRIGVEEAKAIRDALKTNTSLQNIDLNSNQIRDEGAKAFRDLLKVNNSLQIIDLNFNGIKNEGARAIGEALKTNTSIYLISNRIGDEGARVIGDALRIHNSLQFIDLGCNLIEYEGAKALGDALKLNTSLKTMNLGSHMHSKSIHACKQLI